MNKYSPKTKRVKSHICKRCNYTTDLIQNYNKHILTKKHLKNVKQSSDPYQCNVCGSSYKYKSGLYRHNRICNKLSRENEVNVHKSKHEESDLNKIVKTLVKETRELKHKIEDSSSNEPKNVVNIYKNVNIITFLNTQYKDAINLTEFLKTIDITIADLDKIENQGYTVCVTDCIAKSLQELDENQRPIHCTDPKKRQFYIKDDDKWEKDATNFKLDKVINHLNDEHFKVLSDWKTSRPSWKNDEMTMDKVNRITKELSSLYMNHGDKIRKQICANVGDLTYIDAKSK